MNSLHYTILAYGLGTILLWGYAVRLIWRGCRLQSVPDLRKEDVS